jgi:bacteriocin-like protein
MLKTLKRVGKTNYRTMNLKELSFHELMEIEGGTCKCRKSSSSKTVISRNNTAYGNTGVVIQNSGDITINVSPSVTL